MIAHRYTTLEKCDRILELVDGSVANEYSYEELIKKYE
jgi:ABC-type multidrug transport system fused ATPase/permease subunit